MSMHIVVKHMPNDSWAEMLGRLTRRAGDASAAVLGLRNEFVRNLNGGEIHGHAMVPLELYMAALVHIRELAGTETSAESPEEALLWLKAHYLVIKTNGGKIQEDVFTGDQLHAHLGPVLSKEALKSVLTWAKVSPVGGSCRPDTSMSTTAYVRIVRIHGMASDERTTLIELKENNS